MMEFTIKRDYFITQLNDTLKAISRGITIPISVGVGDMVNISERGGVVLRGRFFVDII